MKYVDEYRNQTVAQEIARSIQTMISRPCTIMEICGGQTHAIMKYGIQSFLPAEISLLHGPGCPVCVTPVEIIDKAIEISSYPKVILCSFGDMIRVPGSSEDLALAKSRGGDVRIVYSPLDALKIAEKYPAKQVVFFAIGFETTAPANAMAVLQAARLKLSNFCLLTSQMMILPTMVAILKNSDRINGFLAPGHVCTVTGFKEYEEISKTYHVPIVITGFEPLDILQGIYYAVKQIQDNRADVENQYSRSVRREGNPEALKVIVEVFEPGNAKWRGIGEIPSSGLRLRKKYSHFNAENLFGEVRYLCEESATCIAGEVLKGKKKPIECSAFEKTCRPENPLGAPMVSSEGACNAYFQYRNVSSDGKLRLISNHENN